jgi:hypothetical protein
MLRPLNSEGVNALRRPDDTPQKIFEKRGRGKSSNRSILNYPKQKVRSAIAVD